VTARQQRCAPASLPVRSDSGVDDDDDGEETELECCGRVTAGALGARARAGIILPDSSFSTCSNEGLSIYVGGFGIFGHLLGWFA
jgi:hypothetical protein